MSAQARLPYRDDTFDGEDAAAATAPALAEARARLAEADEAHRRAIYWMRTARPSNRAVRERHLRACARAALETAVALRRLEAGQ